MTWKKFETEKPEVDRWCWLKTKEEDNPRAVVAGVVFWSYIVTQKSNIQELFWRHRPDDMWQYAEVPE